MRRFNFKNIKSGPKNLLYVLFLLVSFLLVISIILDHNKGLKEISYAQLIKDIDQGLIENIKLPSEIGVGAYAYGDYKNNGGRFRAVILNNEDFMRQLDAAILENKINNESKVGNAYIEPQSSSGLSFVNIVTILSIIVPLVLVWFLFVRQSKGGGGASNIFNFSKNKAKMFMPQQIKTDFKSVAGVVEAKEDLKDLVDFLKNPDKYKKIGAKLTKGILLVGEPGNGKTLLAKALAGESHCPFFSVSGSDFIEVFVGVGAARVRDLFAQARKHAPSIIFIDELDSIGKQRGIGFAGGNEEREQTLNQMLAEMDGFETMGAPVVVLAATNRPEILDKALTRKGRFDRQIHIPFPDLASRKEILAVHVKNIKIDKNIDLDVIARGTPGFSGADLANLINEAAIMAAKHNKLIVAQEDLDSAKDLIIMGKRNQSITLSEHERKLTAYHEAGHTLALIFVKYSSSVLHKVSIIPMGHALGVTHFLPEGDLHAFSKEQMIADIIVAMGGRVAEELFCDCQDRGASSDFAKATKCAYAMVANFGMSSLLGPVYYGNNNDSKWYSEKTAQMIDDEVRRIISESYEKTKNILLEHKDKVEIVANALLDKETLTAQEVYSLIGLDIKTVIKI